MRKVRYAQKPVVTLDDLTARLEVKGLFLSKSTLSKIENGQRIALDFEVMEIAKALRVPVGELYGEK
jgi:transcriptional regulator with XRE-family HTH domain